MLTLRVGDRDIQALEAHAVVYTSSPVELAAGSASEIGPPTASVTSRAARSPEETAP